MALRVTKGFTGAPLVDSSELIIGMPSITYNGLVPALILAEPRTLILKPDSNFPLVWFTLTPAAFPTIAFWKLALGISLIDSELIFATLSVSFALVDLP